MMSVKRCCDLSSLAGALGALILFALLANPTAPFEQDHIAKAAKIQFLSETAATVLKPLAGPGDFYRDDMFSLYYMGAAAVYRVIGGNVFGFSNYLAAVCGALFVYFMVGVVRRAVRAPAWLVLFIFLSMPMTVQTFTYGNEVSFSLMFLAMALSLLTRETRRSAAGAGLAFTASFFSRPDIILWLPAISLWGLLHQPGAELLRSRARRLVWFFGTAFIAAVIYWLIFVRKIPQPFGFPWGFNAKLFVAFLTYPFFPPLLALVALGGVRWARQSKLHVTALALFILPILYYARMLSSPKYIWPWLPMIGLLACYGWQTGPRWLRWTVGAGVLFFGLCALTPYGIFGSPRGAFWYLPTADGPAPAGCYAAFYHYSRQGFFQERYLEELETTRVALAYQREHPSFGLAGYFNQQSLIWHWVQAKPRTTSPFGTPVTSDQLPAGTTNAIMARISYLRDNTFRPESQVRLRALLREGRLKAIDGADEPFPKAILIGGGIPPGTDHELGARILFALERSRHTGMVRRSRFCADYAAISWLPLAAAQQYERRGYASVYKDSQFTAFAQEVGGGVIYSALMPLVYYSERDPRTALVHRPVQGAYTNGSEQ